MDKIRVALVEDHVVVRQSLRQFLNREPDLEVVGEAGNGEEAVRLAAQLKPDIALMDVAMPGVSGIEATKRIKANLRVVGTQQRLSPEVELLLFRIIQEAINNARRHAEASKVEVCIEFDEGKMVATVRDNGKGFELPRTLGELSRSGKLGLIGAEERARLLGGSLTVQSEPGKGTIVTIEAPI